MTGANAVLELIDHAPAFVDVVEDPTAIAEAVRQFGLAELTDAMKNLREAGGEARGLMLSAGAQRLGQLVAAGALHEGFAKASIEEAASNCLLIRDDGLKAVRAAIAAGIKLGKKHPRDLSAVRSNVPHVRREATALSRPRPAAVLEPSPSELSAEDPAPSSASSFFAVSPAPPAAEGESTSSQTGAKPDAVSSAGGAGGAEKPPCAIEDDDARHMRLAFFPLTDLGNAERFRERWKNRLKFNTALGWLVWDGKRWSSKGADELVMIAEHETVRSIQDEARVVRESGDKDDDDAPRGARDYVFKQDRDGNKIMYSDKIAGWGRSSEAVNKLGALSKRGAPYFAVGIEDLDADKMKINVNNGTIVLRRSAVGDYVTFQPHDPDDLITKISPVDYLPEATCPEYDKFLARVQPRIEMRRFLHQWGGYSLTGDVSEQILAFFYGKGGNGKSLLIDCWALVAGDYGETLPIETFLDQGKTRSGGQATPDLALLPGIRLLRTSEPEKGSKLAESMVKLVTGGEPIQARKLNKDFFRFYPQFKLTISGNYRPTISGTDEGIWRRMRLVPFDVSIPKDERDRHLIDKLRLEASGILNHLLDGLRDWLDHGLIEPEDVTKATAKYRETSDPLGRFLAACVVAAPGQRVQSSVLHTLYEAWCKSSGEKAWTNRGLSMAMDERGYQRAQSNVMWWHDIKLIHSVDDFVDASGHARTFSKDGEPEQEAGDVAF
jgi:putative DNA primase/helicase